jgi:hypothetical protein
MLSLALSLHLTLAIGQFKTKPSTPEKPAGLSQGSEPTKTSAPSTKPTLPPPPSKPAESVASSGKAAVAKEATPTPPARTVTVGQTLSPSAPATGPQRTPSMIDPDVLRRHFDGFLNAEDLLDMQQHFTAVTAMIGANAWRNRPDFYVQLRKVVRKRLSYRQQRVFEVNYGFWCCFARNSEVECPYFDVENFWTDVLL